MTFAPTRFNYRAWIVLSLLVLLGLAHQVQAQTTAFTYQGKLADGGNLANGSYDMQFKVFDAATVGTGAQQGSTVTLPAVQITDGIFTVQLNFGAGVFPGAGRFLEIAVKAAGGGAFTTLAPRQPVSSTPYAIRSLNSVTADGLSVACVNCVTSSQILNVQGAQVTGDIAGSQISGLIPVASVPPGSPDYIQNGASPQAAASFNISGNGTAGGTLSANFVNSARQYNIGGNRVLSISGTNNMFAGLGTGAANTGGTENAFFGNSAGQSNTDGSSNAFFGFLAGQSNTTVCCNSYFGAGAGQHTDAGGGNAFFGYAAGNTNTAGGGNAFFGDSTGYSNTTGDFNSFFGRGTGFANTTGENNVFIGYASGGSNTTTSGNTFVGSLTGAFTTGPNNAFFGFASGNSNSTGAFNSFFGYQAGFANTTGNGNSFFGNFAGAATTTACCNAFFGSQAGRANTSGTFNAFFGTDIGLNNTEGSSNAFFGNFAGNNNTTGSNNTFIGAGAGNPDPAVQLSFATAIGSLAIVSTSNTIALGRNNGSDTVLVPGLVQVNTLATAGSTSLCRNAANQIATCSSSLRYKTDLHPFTSGLALINRLKPITFRWKSDNQLDLGFGAEEVAVVEPLLVTHNAQGQVEGVKYDRISAALVNAVKEQQAQIAAQQRQIDELKAIRAENAELKAQIAAILARLEQAQTRRAERK
jgi:hypothetical protein